MVVGIALHNVSAQESRVAPRTSVGTRAYGVTINRPVPGKLPIRVAAPVMSQAPRGVKLYALFDPDSETGLCNAYPIGQDFISFRSTELQRSRSVTAERSGANSSCM